MFAVWSYILLVFFTVGGVTGDDSPPVDPTGSLGARLIRARREPIKCPRGKYLDKITGRCDLCGPHCHVTFLNPPSDCRDFCHKMTSPEEPPKPKQDSQENKNECPDSYYRDPGTENCDPCLPYCDRISQEKPPGECVTFCKKATLTTEPPRDIDPKEATVSLTAIVVTVLAVGMIVVSVVGIYVLILRRRRRRRGNNMNVNDSIAEEQEPFKPSIPEQTADREKTEIVTNLATSAV